MKSLFFAFALTLTSAAHAITVGDSATYTGFINGVPIAMTLIVTDISGNEYITKGTMSSGGQTSTLDEEYNSIRDLESANEIYAHCTSYGGHLEQVKTPIKVFFACHVLDDGDHFYLSPEVPFSFVRAIKISGGDQTELLLQSFVQH